jgi:phosphoglycerate kinase
MNTRWSDHGLPDVRTLRGKKVVVRLDWNMPVANGVITDTSRFDVTVPFLKRLSMAGVKMILLTHFGEKGESLLPVANHALHDLPFISFNPSKDFDELRTGADNLKEGDAMLLENVRLFEGETDGSQTLAESFASLGDVFINDAFSVAHRKHASVVGIPEKLLSYFGPTFEHELENLTKALTPTQPALLIVGGAKIATKLALIKQYLDQGVKVFVGGAMVHNIWKERGLEIGKSLYDPEYHLPETFYRHPLLLTPVDVVLATGETVDVTAIPEDGVVVDCGEKTVAMLQEVINVSNTIIANGPLGLYEKGWLKGSEHILTNVAGSNAATYIGGGDTVTVANSLHMLDKFTFVSLGGGAMLDFLSSGTLPGVDAITK